MINPKDYVLTRENEKSRFHLVRVTSVKGDTIHGRLEKDPHIKPIPAEVPRSAVVLNLGPKPVAGKVYGLDLSFIFRKTIDMGPYGDMHLFTNVPAETLGVFKVEANIVFKLLKKNRLEFLLNDDLVWQIVSRETSGKYSGWFQPTKLNDAGEVKSPPRISITLEEDSLSKASIAKYTYVIAHELGHYLHFNWLKNSRKNDRSWMALFSDTVRPRTVSSESLKSLLEGFISTQSTTGGFLSTLEEDDQVVFKHALKEVQRTSHLSFRELNALVEDSETTEVVRSAWPKKAVLTNLSPMITEYALKNYHELFAETFAFWLLGRKLPKPLTDLMEQSVSFCRKTQKP